MVPAALAGGKLGDPDVKEAATSLATLQGMLGHVYHVRDQVDPRTSAEKKGEKTATATRHLYIRFLFYRNFVVAPKPLIIPEGKTDSVYLRAAMEKLTTFHPQLGAMDKGKFRPAVKFMNFSAAIHDVLQIGNGAGDSGFILLADHRRHHLAHIRRSCRRGAARLKRLGIGDVTGDVFGRFPKQGSGWRELFTFVPPSDRAVRAEVHLIAPDIAPSDEKLPVIANTDCIA